MKGYFEKFPDKLPDNRIRSTALRRGYVATFEIDNNQLFLKDIGIIDRTKNDEAERSILADITDDSDRLKIDWFSGLLVLQEIDQANGEIYRGGNYVLIEANKGNIGRAREFDHKGLQEFKEKQFAQFRNSPEYEGAVEEIRKQDKDRDTGAIDNVLKHSIFTYTSLFLFD